VARLFFVLSTFTALLLDTFALFVLAIGALLSLDMNILLNGRTTRGNRLAAFALIMLDLALFVLAFALLVLALVLLVLAFVLLVLAFVLLVLAFVLLVLALAGFICHVFSLKPTNSERRRESLLSPGSSPYPMMLPTFRLFHLIPRSLV
jgi:hypothetical protein